MSFICQEAKEFAHDIECIKYLMKLCKKNDIDTNSYYELNYYKHKLQDWKRLGVETNLIKEEIDSLLSAINVLLMTITDEKAKELLDGKVISDFSYFDKLKYTNSNGFKGKIGITRNIYPKGFEDRYDNKLVSLILTVIFSPLVSIFVCFLISFCVNSLNNSIELGILKPRITSLPFNFSDRTFFILSIILYVLLVGTHFIHFMKEVGLEKIVYLHYYKINEIANIYGDEEYVFEYTKTPRKVEEIQDRVLRARYMLANESCLESLLYTYKYYVTNYQSEESALYVILPDESELNAKFFFDIYAKAEYELDKYLKEQYQLKLKHKSEQSASMEEMMNEYLSQYNHYIN